VRRRTDRPQSQHCLLLFFFDASLIATSGLTFDMARRGGGGRGEVGEARR
jgi:hypothetical protein